MSAQLDLFTWANSSRRAEWTPACQRILARSAAHLSNGDMADQIERETGIRHSIFTVSRYRAAAGLPSPRVNYWTAPLARWRQIEAMA